MTRNYIGLATTFHDPALAIVNSKGEVVFAEATERYMQNKRAFNCVPDNYYYVKKLIDEYCEPNAELVIAKTWSQQNTKRLPMATKMLPLLQRFLPPVQFQLVNTFLRGQMSNAQLAGTNIRLVTTLDFSDYMRKGKSRVKIHDRAYNHHLTHAASACFASPYDDALCLVIDGFGEDASLAYYEYRHGQLTPLPMTHKSVIPSLSASLGLFYSMLAEACGFEATHGEEWKLMGFAPYGQLDQEIYQWLRPILKRQGNNLVAGKDYKQIVTRLASMTRQPGQSVDGFANLAHTGHIIFCEIFKELLDELYKTGFSKNLVLTGGCALNSAWAGKVVEQTPFENLFIPSAPADDGNAIGAALLAYQEDNANFSPKKIIQSPYLGAKMSPASVEKLKNFGQLKNTLPAGQCVYQRTAELLAEGKIVGWVQGRAEFGPRALGNRSILADPRSADVKERINASVKFREEFRPFAPSILHEYGDDYFENYQETPYMERALVFKQEVRERVPGVVHVDGTGRLQSVKKEWNSDYYQLISAFNDITGVPILLNTSFNVMGKPIIHSVEDSVAVFFTSGLDVLVIGDQIFEKQPSATTQIAQPENTEELVD